MIKSMAKNSVKCEECGEVLVEEIPDFYPSWVSYPRLGYVHYFCVIHKPEDADKWLGMYPEQGKEGKEE